jgi:hypothetical protein
MVSPVEAMYLQDRAHVLDTGKNKHDFKNIVTACARGARIAERIARELIDSASLAVHETGDLIRAGEELDDVLSQVEYLKLYVTAARWRREIPKDISKRRLDEIIKELAQFA